MSNYKADDMQTAANVASRVETEKKSGIIDWRYLKGYPGLLKALQAVFSLIAYLCVEIGHTFCIGHSATTGYFKFVTMFAFATILIVYAILLLKLNTRIFRRFWPIIELSYYGGLLIFYLFADLFMSLHACHGTHKAGAAFGWFALAVFAVDGFFALRAFQQARKSPDHMKSSTLEDDSEQRY